MYNYLILPGESGGVPANVPTGDWKSTTPLPTNNTTEDDHDCGCGCGGTCSDDEKRRKWLWILGGSILLLCVVSYNLFFHPKK